MALVHRALALNPSDARCRYASGVVRLWAGQSDLAIEHVRSSPCLSPRERTGMSQSRIGEARLFQHRFDKAVSTFLLSIQQTPPLRSPTAFLLRNYAHIRRLDKARDIIAQLRAIPSVVAKRFALSQFGAARAVPVGLAPRRHRTDMSQTRRLAAILAADVTGYSRLIGGDEEGTLDALKAICRELGDPKVKEHRGRIVKTTGDSLLVEFSSVVDAVRCAVEVQ
jgi:hypothetical protein